MTRFARARGSKSSNKREPEEATSWSQLKEGLLKKSDSSTLVDKAQEIQKCKDRLRELQQESHVSWSTFDDISEVPNGVKKSEHKKNKCEVDKTGVTTDDKNKVKINKKRKTKSTEGTIDDLHDMNDCAPKKKKDSSKKSVVKMDNENGTQIKKKKATDSIGNINDSCSKEKKDIKKKTLPKKEEKETKRLNELNNMCDLAENNESNVRKNKKKKKAKPEVKDEKVTIDPNISSQKTSVDKCGFPKTKKNKKDFKRKKPLPEPYQMDLNGDMVDVITYDGFPIMLQDAKRLDDLKKSLYAKGIPNAEIKKIMKLQRRSAEKALTRARKRVCFNCRRSGHPLSECPSLNQGEGTGICFKCGSTEHTHFECRVVKKQEYKFAQCFICKEQGHISNQCPDNPRGLYPKGGACKLCGDVTHLKRFCPTLPKESEPTINNFLNIEDTTRQKKIGAKSKSHKIVRF